MSRKILVVYHHLPNYRYGVFKALQDSSGYEFHFAAGAASRDGSIPVIAPNGLRNHHALKNIWFGKFLWQRGLLSLVRENHWDAVIFLGDFGHISTWIASLVTRVRRTPSLFWTIGWHRPESGIRRVLRICFYSLSNKLLLYGNTGRNIGIEMGFPADRMVVIYNSSTTLDRRRETISVGPPGNYTATVGAVIRLNPVKRLDLLIEAVGIANRRGESIAVEILGEGPERNLLQKMATDHGVDLSLPGAAYDQETLMDFYKRVAVTVIPSIAGLSVTQSLSFGRPSITHNNMYEQAPESEAIIEGVTGGYYNFGSVEHLADVISLWVGRMRKDWQQIEAKCHEEIEARWTASAQAKAIINELQTFEVTTGSTSAHPGLGQGQA